MITSLPFGVKFFAAPPKDYNNAVPCSSMLQQQYDPTYICIEWGCIKHFSTFVYDGINKQGTEEQLGRAASSFPCVEI